MKGGGEGEGELALGPSTSFNRLPLVLENYLLVNEIMMEKIVQFCFSNSMVCISKQRVRCLKASHDDM
jgi:hypothetical protein